MSFEASGNWQLQLNKVTYCICHQEVSWNNHSPGSFIYKYLLTTLTWKKQCKRGIQTLEHCLKISERLNLLTDMLIFMHLAYELHILTLEYAGTYSHICQKRCLYFGIKIADEPGGIFAYVLNSPIIMDALWMPHPFPPSHSIMFWAVIMVLEIYGDAYFLSR